MCHPPLNVSSKTMCTRAGRILIRIGICIPFSRTSKLCRTAKLTVVQSASKSDSGHSQDSNVDRWHRGKTAS